MFCKSCGASIPKGSPFCPTCWTVVPPEAESSIEPYLQADPTTELETVEVPEFEPISQSPAYMDAPTTQPSPLEPLPASVIPTYDSSPASETFAYDAPPPDPPPAHEPPPGPVPMEPAYGDTYSRPAPTSMQYPPMMPSIFQFNMSRVAIMGAFLAIVALAIVLIAMDSVHWYAVESHVSDTMLGEPFTLDIEIRYGLSKVLIDGKEQRPNGETASLRQTSRYDAGNFPTEHPNIYKVADNTRTVLWAGVILLIMFMVLAFIGGVGTFDRMQKGVRALPGLIGLVSFIVLLAALAHFIVLMPGAVDEDLGEAEDIEAFAIMFEFEKERVEYAWIIALVGVIILLASTMMVLTKVKLKHTSAESEEVYYPPTTPPTMYTYALAGGSNMGMTSCPSCGAGLDPGETSCIFCGWVQY